MRTEIDKDSSDEAECIGQQKRDAMLMAEGIDHDSDGIRDFGENHAMEVPQNVEISEGKGRQDVHLGEGVELTKRADHGFGAIPAGKGRGIGGGQVEVAAKIHFGEVAIVEKGQARNTRKAEILGDFKADWTETIQEDLGTHDGFHRC